MAAERAPTMATTIQTICRSDGQPGWPPCTLAKRAASSAPVSANGSAKTECSNLIISSTVRMRFVVIVEKKSSRFGLFRGARSAPAVHLLLRQTDLREYAARILRDQVIDRLRLMIKRGNRGHDHRAGQLRAQHIFKVDPVERR